MTRVSAEVRAALALHASASPRAVHELEIRLAKLLLSHADAGSLARLEVAERYLSGTASASELKSAQQDGWTYVGALACGCSLAESLFGAAVLVCLGHDPGAHTPEALAEQALRTLRAGSPESDVLNALAGAD